MTFEKPVPDGFEVRGLIYSERGTVEGINLLGWTRDI